MVPGRLGLERAEVEEVKFLAEFAELNPDLVFVLDERGKVIEMNPASRQFVGPQGVSLGGPFLDCVAAKFREDLGRLLNDPPGSAAVVRRVQLVDALRRPRWFEVQRLRSPDRPLVYVHGRDISRLIEVEQTLESEKQKSFFTAKLAALGEMAGGVAHEINNPLAVILMSAEMLDNDIKAGRLDSARMAKGVAAISLQAERVSKIVRGLKAMARNEGSEPKSPHSVRALVDDVFSISKEKFKGADVRLEQTPFEDFEVPCRPVQIMQIMLNLLNNALDATRGQSEKWVRIDIRKVFETFEFSVTDSGPGIPPEILTKIMQPFFTTKEVGKGTGLGLSISRAIAEEHGGRLFYDSHSRNTRFVLQLPFREGASLTAISADDAITAHLAWKDRLAKHFETADSALNPSDIATDNKCSLGMWIYGVEDRHRNMETFEKLKTVHASFHVCTSKLVTRRNSGEKMDPQTILGAGSEYDKLSLEVIRLINKLKEELEASSRS